MHRDIELAKWRKCAENAVITKAGRLSVCVTARKSRYKLCSKLRDYVRDRISGCHLFVRYPAIVPRCCGVLQSLFLITTNEKFRPSTKLWNIFVIIPIPIVSILLPINCSFLANQLQP